ncbi:adenylate kinase family protein [Candidatus Woesearchaeota archaeon]|nr:adenylate kinase family protein [Candidatus Woesearchaeota archaeon]
MKLIVITGTPGTGKTALAKELSLLLRYRYVGQSEIVKKGAKGISEGYDKIRRTLIVDERKFSKAAVALIKALQGSKTPPKGVIIDSHISHFLPMKQVDLCVVTRCSSLKALKKRLEAKGYGTAKVRENLDAEIFDTCLVEAEEMGHKVLAVDTAWKSPKTIAKTVTKAIKEQA